MNPPSAHINLLEIGHRSPAETISLQTLGSRSSTFGEAHEVCKGSVQHLLVLVFSLIRYLVSPSLVDNQLYSESFLLIAVKVMSSALLIDLSKF